MWCENLENHVYQTFKTLVNMIFEITYPIFLPLIYHI